MCCPFTEIIERASNNKYKSHWNLCIICLFTSMEVNNEPQTDVWRASEWTWWLTFVFLLLLFSSFVRSQNMCGDMRWCVNAYASRGGGTNGHWHTLHTHTCTRACEMNRSSVKNKKRIAIMIVLTHPQWREVGPAAYVGRSMCAHCR